MGGTASAEVADQAPYLKEGSEHHAQYDEGVHWRSRREDSLPCRSAQKGTAGLSECKYVTIPSLFEAAAKLKGKKIAFRVERGEGNTLPKESDKTLPWKSWTYQEYYDESCMAARAFLALGLEKASGVCIFGFNSPEWFMSYMGSICAGGIAIGIYPSDREDQVAYKALHGGATIAVVQGEKEATSFVNLAKEGKLPKLKAIVYWSPETKIESFQNKDGATVEVMYWGALQTWAKKTSDAELTSAQKSQNPGSACCLVYTSGTTGNPKAVMLSHDNYHYESWCVKELIGGHKLTGEQRILSYLPLSHVAGMLVDIVAPMVLSARVPGWVTVTFARPYDLKAGTLKHRLVATKPTLFLGVPRVWEKIEQALKELREKNPPGACKLWMVDNAKASGLEFAKQRLMGGTGKSPSCHTSCLNNTVYSAVKAGLGLDKLVMAFTGAAPIQTETLEYFGQFGIDIHEIYGMSECTGGTTSNGHTARLWGSCGFALSGMEVAILQPDPANTSNFTRCQPCPPADLLSPTLSEQYQGEVCFRGRHIMMGYLANPELGDEHVKEIEQKNADAIDKNGWLHSGDKGALDTRGMLKITGRYKELIITAGGENVAPVPIEGCIKDLLGGAINNVMMVGDKRKFNIVLVTLCTNGATGEKPGTNELSGAARSVSSSTKVQEAVSDQIWIKKIEAAIKQCNSTGSVVPSAACRVQKFSILPHDFSVLTGELTPTFKLKRSMVEATYKELIDSMYSEENVENNYIKCQAENNVPFQ
eukprot:TRINITY_DN7820_c2_g2_i1.p1 TRINITY_DN7820_c2_g2~~TRINITY_DN7820_c2_g2_i1.p1  ORF type:complete len:761 (+),score=146.65 TRINITY_DN7820_c2_g2_i1:58-2340(+)